MARSLKENSVKEAILTELREMIGPVRTFRSYADHIPPEVQVVTKDCSYTAERLNDWAEVYWENHRPWYAPWKKCIGFTVYCPPAFRLLGNVPHCRSGTSDAKGPGCTGRVPCIVLSAGEGFDGALGSVSTTCGLIYGSAHNNLNT